MPQIPLSINISARASSQHQIRKGAQRTRPRRFSLFVWDLLLWKTSNLRFSQLPPPTFGGKIFAEAVE